MIELIAMSTHRHGIYAKIQLSVADDIGDRFFQYRLQCGSIIGSNENQDHVSQGKTSGDELLRIWYAANLLVNRKLTRESESAQIYTPLRP